MKVLLIGGRGFLGSAVKKSLKGFDVYTFDRSKGGKKHLKGDLLVEESVKKSLKGFDVVINLVGLSPLREPKKVSYSEAHVEGVRNILFHLKKKQKFIHISALGADVNSEAEYLRTKGKAEQLIRNSGKDYFILRPSLLFGKDHEFFKTLDWSKYFLFFPNIITLTQPVHKSDVGKLINLILKGKVKRRVIELGGIHKLSIFQVSKLYINSKGFPVFKIPWFLFKSGYIFISWFKIFGITKNQVLILNHDNITSENHLLDYIEPLSYYDWIGKI